MKKIIVILVILLFLPAFSSADYCNGMKIMKHVDSKDSVSKSLTIGYITGVVDAFNEVLFCIPYGVTIGQANEVFIKWMREHPERWHESASILILAALKEVWPCESKGSKK